jgi:phosphate transport system protein
MVREVFQERIKELEKEVIEMGEMVITAINRSIEALKSRDLEEAKNIINDDLLINKRRWDIEERCINLISTQQPVATDLRTLITILNIITELERMGDHAEGIARVVILYGDKPLIKPLIDIPRMAEKVNSMIKRSLDSLVNRDAKTAREICSEDDMIDSLHEQVYRELLTFMLEDPKKITGSTYLIWVSRHLERVADRVTNICERVIYLVTGVMEEIEVSRY